jgi:virulence factor Mce-like protein
MRFGKRQLVNVILVAVIGVVSIAWAAVGLAGIRFDHPKQITVHLAQTGGALPGAEVDYLGVPVGKVASSKLVPGAVELKLTVRPKGPMPKDLRADVVQKSSLGEPFLDLGPADPAQAAPGDPNGTTIPIERTSAPQPLYNLLDSMNGLLQQIKPDDVAALSNGLSGLVGHADDIKGALQSWATVGEVLANRKAELGDLLSASAKMAASLDANRESLAGAISGYAQLGQVLDNHLKELDDIIKRGGQLGAVGSDLLTKTDTDLKQGVLPGLDVTFHNIAIRPQKVKETMYWLPEFMEKVGYTLDGTTMNIGVGNSFPLFPTYQPNLAVPIYGEGLRLDKIFLPTLAQRIEIDAGQRGSAAAPPMLRILSPEEAAYALQGPAQTAQVQQQEQQKLATQGPSETP